MIARYTRQEIGAVWTDEARFAAMRDVEVAAASELEGPTHDELEAIRASTFTVDAIDEREKVTDHDTAAFVDVLAASAGPAGRWIHYGLTSSDVVDTGLALQLKRAGGLLVPAARQLAAPGMSRRAGVSVTPARIALAVIPAGASSSANCRMWASRIALAALTGPYSGMARVMPRTRAGSTAVSTPAGVAVISIVPPMRSAVRS